jgi:hypothetical protein
LGGRYQHRPLFVFLFSSIPRQEQQMARPRKSTPGLAGLPVPPHFAAWAEALGEALGRGVARGINVGLAPLSSGAAAPGKKPRGRPPKAVAGPVPPERRCKDEGCPREARSKGLCSAHYQAERRKILQKKA